VCCSMCVCVYYLIDITARACAYGACKGLARRAACACSRLYLVRIDIIRLFSVARHADAC
jgi:hypothetical protein